MTSAAVDESSEFVEFPLSNLIPKRNRRLIWCRRRNDANSQYWGSRARERDLCTANTDCGRERAASSEGAAVTRIGQSGNLISVHTLETKGARTRYSWCLRSLFCYGSAFYEWDLTDETYAWPLEGPGAQIRLRAVLMCVANSICRRPHRCATHSGAFLYIFRTQNHSLVILVELLFSGIIY